MLRNVTEHSIFTHRGSDGIRLWGIVLGNERAIYSTRLFFLSTFWLFDAIYVISFWAYSQGLYKTPYSQLKVHYEKEYPQWARALPTAAGARFSFSVFKWFQIIISHSKVLSLDLTFTITLVYSRSFLSKVNCFQKSPLETWITGCLIQRCLM